MSSEHASGTPEVSPGELSYKYQRLRERLRNAVTCGELTGKLPGERELARRYSANAKTINKALNDLAMEGLVLRHVGRGTYVIGSSPAAAATLSLPARNYAWLCHRSSDQTDGDQVFGAARSILEGRGHCLEQYEAQLDSSGELPESTFSPRSLRQIDGVMVFLARPSRGLLASLRRRHLSVVLINNHHEDIRLPSVLSDQAHGAFSLCVKCIQLGHRRIQLAMRPESLPAASAAQAGYEAAMAYYGLPARPVTQVSPGADWTAILQGENRPTALVCVSGPVVMEAKRACQQAGLAIPGQISLAVICDPGESCGRSASITAYEFDSQRIVNLATELITQGMSPNGPEIVIVPGRIIDRGSVAVLPGSERSPDPVREVRI